MEPSPSHLPSSESDDDLPSCYIADRIGRTSVEKCNDVLTYLKEVKDTFKHQREKFDWFRDVMIDFIAGRYDARDVFAAGKKLFEGHDNLIWGFRKLLPDEKEFPPKRSADFEDALRFVDKVEKHFENDVHIYKSFLDILDMYRKKQKGINEAYCEVAALFGDHPDLIVAFTRFLPDTSAAASASYHEAATLPHEFKSLAKHTRGRDGMSK